MLARTSADCVLGRKSLIEGVCPEQYQRTRFMWEVLHSGAVVARGNSYPPPSEAQRLGIALPLDQSFGTFFADAGERYTVRLNVETDARDFNNLGPTLVVARSIRGLCERDR